MEKTYSEKDTFSMEDTLNDLLGDRYNKRKNNIQVNIPKDSAHHLELSERTTLKELGDILTEKMRTECGVSTRVNLTLQYGQNQQGKYALTALDVHTANPCFMELVDLINRMPPEKCEKLQVFLEDKSLKKLRKGVFSVIDY